MNVKKIITMALSLFVVGSLAYLAISEKRSNEATNIGIEKEANAKTDMPSNSTNIKQGSNKKTIVYYFHTTFRCHSCHKIEELTKKAVAEGFAEDIKKGSLAMTLVNIDEPQNKHFIEDYKLFTKTVIVSVMKDGKQIKWKNLDQVWKLLGNEADFIKYIQDGIRSYLEDK